MNIIVNASAARTSGALSIYKQFISHLKDNIKGNKYYIFVDCSVPKPSMENVTYICENNHSWLHRIYWDYIGCRKWIKRHKIKPDVIVSLQNSGIITNCRQVIYFHQSIPFYTKKWSFFKKEERLFAMYKYLYPLIIAPTFSKNTDVVVQIPFMKKGFMKKFQHAGDKVHVLFPDIHVELPENCVQDMELQQRPYFIYPAIGAKYKQHRTIVNAVVIVKERYPELSDKIRVLFSLNKDSNIALWNYIKSNNCESNFEFIGQVAHKDLMRLVKNCCALLFPSTIESLGLPLMEAAAMGKAIIASDRDYSREVLLDYKGVVFLPYDDYGKWADVMKSRYESKYQFPPFKRHGSNWESFFKLIENYND